MPFPPAARPDLAYVWRYSFPTQTTAAYGQATKVPGTYFEVVLGVTMQYTASAAPGVRNQYVTLDPPTGAPQQYGNTFVQTANHEITWTWGIGITAAGVDTLQGFGTIPLPPIPVLPGGAWEILTSGQTGDLVSAVAATTIRIPTGPDATRPDFTPTLQLT